jgi:hypothetical protein
MDEKELLTLCQSEALTSFKIIPSPYWTAEIYSLGKYIRKYGYYPSFLPLCIYTDHGAGIIGCPPYEHELNSDAPCQFYHAPKAVEEWRKVSSKPCYVLYSPSVFYRKLRKIEKAQDAKGTIAYPAHTTPSIEDVSDVEEYIKQLLNLPERFQPISVCLHMHDVIKGKFKIFQKYNIPVYTAGNSSDDRFIERFYSILRNFSYATSNMVGSYLYYAVEMGIPFSIYGNREVFINKEDTNITIGEWDPYKESRHYREAFDLFNGLYTDITQEQRSLVENDLGLSEGISRFHMSVVLYRSFIQWTLSRAGLKFVAAGIKRKLFSR